MVARNDSDIEAMLDAGWTSADLVHISNLPRFWKQQCGLGFIRSGDLSFSWVSQGEESDEAVIEYR